jgi:hypothetical protein
VDAAAPVVAPAAPAPEADAFATDPSATATEAELGAQSDADADQAMADLDGEESALNIYGFADFTYTHLLSDREEWNGVTFGYPSFYVGNLNLYLSANLGSNWRALSEVRFTYLPDGVETSDYSTGTAVVSRTSTAATDYSDYGRPVDVGGVIIERAWVEYAAHPLFTARFGQWLTPYGIWNVDHGSPAIVGTTRPFIIGAEMFPQRQTGIELYGSYGMESTQLGYHLTVSNGRGPVDTYRDYDKNKALGWRLWGQQDTKVGTFVLGTSGYKGRYTDRFQTTVFDTLDTGELEWAYDYPISSAYKELSLAADFKWTWGGALFQAEAIMHDVAYIEATRPAASVFDGGPQGWTPDYRNWGAYGLMGYRFDWLGVMPYFGGEYWREGKSVAWPDAMAFWGGLNVRPTERVVLKLQGVCSVRPTDWIGIKTPSAMKQLIAQIAWSF